MSTEWNDKGEKISVNRYVNDILEEIIFEST